MRRSATYRLMYRRMRGPRTRVTGKGKRFQISTARLMPPLSRSSVRLFTSPRVKRYQYKGSGRAPHCSLKR